MFGNGCFLTQHFLSKVVWKYFIKYMLAKIIGQYTIKNH